ncbi:MAG: hypothetical protein ACLFPJ_05570 [Candidatus Woesearchaeota archaeon]
MSFFENFKKIWDLIEIPTYFMFIWTIFIIIFPLDKYFDAIFSQLLSLFIFISYFWYLGYLVFKNEELFEKSFIIGLFAGVILGLFSAIVTLITYYFYPSIFIEPIQIMVESGLSNEQALIFFKIGMYLSILISPVINGFFGGLITWVSFIFFKKFKSNEEIKKIEDIDDKKVISVEKNSKKIKKSKQSKKFVTKK